MRGYSAGPFIWEREASDASRACLKVIVETPDSVNLPLNQRNFETITYKLLGLSRGKLNLNF